MGELSQMMTKAALITPSQTKKHLLKQFFKLPQQWLWLDSLTYSIVIAVMIN